MNGIAMWSAEDIARVRARVPNAADEDIRAVLTKYQERGTIHDPVAFAVSGVNGGLTRDLADTAAKRRKAEARRIIDEQKTGPECEHGVPGGASLHPETGLPLCPVCRAKTRARSAGKPARTADNSPGPAGAAVAGGSQDDQEEEFFLPEAPVFPHEKAQGPLRDLLDWAAADGLPVSYVAAAAEVAGAGAAAYGPGAVLRLTGVRVIRTPLWQVLIGESGDGKNPSIRHATAPVEHYYGELHKNWQTRCQDGGGPYPRPQALMQSSIGIEAMVRWLDATDGAGILRNGELASFLRGLGQYKRGGGSDRFDVMDMWSGESISLERVGPGGKRNAIYLYVPVPRLSVIGGLVPENLKLLGPEADGLRARFLPVLPSSPVVPRMDGGEDIPRSWDDAIRRLYECQELREWMLSDEARALINVAIRRWTNRKRTGADPVAVRTALGKADEQCLRLALTVSELAEPGKGGEIPEWAAVYAIARMDYALGCWLALGSDQTMAFSRKDEVLNAAVADLRRLIERQPAGQDGRKSMTRRQIQQSHVGGATTPNLVDDLIRAYLRAYPHTVVVFTEVDLAKFPAARLVDRAAADAGRRGPAPVIVYAPRRVRQQQL